MTQPLADQARPRGPSPKHRRRLLATRLILSAVIVGLSVWLAGAAQSPSSSLIESALLLLLAALLPIHLFFWQLGGIKLLDRARRLPRPLAIVIAYAALASSPMVLYPLGALAVVVALFAGGGAATPALAVSGLLMLSPIFLIVGIGLLFVLSGYKGG